MAVKTALADNPQIVSAQQAVTAATQNVAVARTGLQPSVSFQGTGGEGTSTTSINGVTVGLPALQGTASAGVVGNLPIFDAGKTAAQVALAQSTLASDEAALKQTEQTIELNTATAFFNVLSAEQQTTVEQAALTQAQQNLALTQAQVRAGVAPQSDVIQAQAQVAQAEVNFLNAQSQIATTKSALQAVLGADVTSDVAVQQPPAPPAQVTVASAQVIEQALINRAEIATAQAVVQNAQAGVQQAQVLAGPQINVALTAGYTPYNTTSSFTNNTSAASYGLTGTVNLPLFDSGKGKAEIAAAQASLKQAQAQLASAQLTVRQSAYQAYLIAVQDAANVTATRAAAQAADQALAVAQGQYRAGVTTFLQVTTAQTTAATADVAAVTALFAYQSALAALQNAQGLSILSSAAGGAS
jgi:outer membrane protein